MLTKLGRPLAVGLSLAILLAGVAIWSASWHAFAARGYIGIDERIWADFGRLWLATGTPYQAHQLAGPYDAYDQSAPTANLYPPPFALVGVALTFMPPVLWWAIPIGVLAGLIANWRPAAWTWPLLAVCVAWPTTAAMTIVGNSALPIAALVAAGLRWGWPAPLILLKPTFAPLALVGIRKRSWWIALGMLAGVSLLLLPLWHDYLTALVNARGTRPLGALDALPLIAIPVVSWAGRRPVAPSHTRRAAGRPRAVWASTVEKAGATSRALSRDQR